MSIFQTLRSVYPVWVGIVELLKPSEIIDLCIATRICLTVDEKRRFVYPLREIFHSPLVPETVTDHTNIAVLGDDVCKLLDSSYTNVRIGLLSLTPKSETPLGLFPTSGSLTAPTRVLDNVWSEVDVVAFNIRNERAIRPSKRVTVYMCIMDDIHTYVLSINLLLDLVKMNDTLRNFKYGRHMTEASIELQFILYNWFVGRDSSVHRNEVSGVQRLALTKYNDRRCWHCQAVVYSSVRTDRDYWPSYSPIGMADIIWRLWKTESSCVRHVSEIESFEPCVVVV